MSALACFRAKSSRCRWRCRHVLPTRCFALPQLADWRCGEGVDGAWGGDDGDEGDWMAGAAGSLGYFLWRARWRAAWLFLGFFPLLCRTLRRDRRR